MIKLIICWLLQWFLCETWCTREKATKFLCTIKVLGKLFEKVLLILIIKIKLMFSWGRQWLLLVISNSFLLPNYYCSSRFSIRWLLFFHHVMGSRCNIFLFSYLRCRRVAIKTTRTSITEMLVKIFFFIFIISCILFLILIEIIILVLHVIVLCTSCIESFRLLEK